MATLTLFSMVLSFLFFAFLAYLAYRLIFGLILPIYRTTRKVKRSFREMHERMQQQEASRDPYATSDNGRGTTGKSAEQGDYIEFEEVK